MTYVLIMLMIGMNGGGVATAEFSTEKACMRAGEEFVQMGSFQSPKFVYRCVSK